MTGADATQTISGDKYDAWLFDLDGVITDTASVHGAAWKQMFDEYLEVVAERDNVPFKEFEVATDYIDYVDGKPRYEGVDTFLRSRGIELEWGDPADPADEHSYYTRLTQTDGQMACSSPVWIQAAEPVAD